MQYNDSRVRKTVIIQNVVNTSSFKPAGLITPTVLFSISPQVLTFALAAGPQGQCALGQEGTLRWLKAFPEEAPKEGPGPRWNSNGGQQR